MSRRTLTGDALHVYHGRGGQISRVVCTDGDGREHDLAGILRIRAINRKVTIGELQTVELVIHAHLVEHDSTA